MRRWPHAAQGNCQRLVKSATIATPMMRILPLTLLLSACATQLAPPGPYAGPPRLAEHAFVMPDGVSLPVRTWLPAAPPKAVVLALHGMNDSRDAWDLPGSVLAEHGLAVFAPDQRGFGATVSRGYWATTEGLARDASAMAAVLRARFPDARLILMGESMGAAVLLVAATGNQPPDADAYVMLAPGVWGRSKMNPFMRATLWLAATITPGLVLRPDGVVRVTATDNQEALRALSANPLTIKGTRVDAVRGLVDLMDAALAAAPAFRAPALFLYGGRDELIPERATEALWRTLPAAARRAFYPGGYHLLPRDLGRAVPIADIIAWTQNPDAPLPSGADRQADAWMETRTTRR